MSTFDKPAACRAARTWSFVFLLILAVPVTSLSQNQGPSRFLRWAAQDALAVTKMSIAYLPLAAFSGGAVLLPTSVSDRHVTHEIQETYVASPLLAGFLDVTNELGGPKMAIPMYGLFAASLFTKNQRFQDAAFTSVESVLYAGMITGALKSVFGRARPEDGMEPGLLHPFSGNTSFPSGHTTQAFALLTPWVMYYPHAATYGLFVLGAGTAVARVALEKHWMTDVLAGATIGVLTGRWLSRRHIRQTRWGDLDIRPTVGANGIGVNLQLQFK